MLKTCQFMSISIQFKCEFPTDQFCVQELEKTRRDVIFAVPAWVLEKENGLIQDHIKSEFK